MLTEREQLIVDFLKRDHGDAALNSYGDAFAEAIERGEHLKRPDPTIPASEWIGNPSVGYGET